MDIPDWVAPAGTPRDDLELGDRVSFAIRLTETLGVMNGQWAGWLRTTHDPQEGVIVGLRFPYSGEYCEGKFSRAIGTLYEEEWKPAYRVRKITHRAYLVAIHLRQKPVHVLSDDIERQES
jgi:hypothetical protein